MAPRRECNRVTCICAAGVACILLVGYEKMTWSCGDVGMEFLSFLEAVFLRCTESSVLSSHLCGSCISGGRVSAITRVPPHHLKYVLTYVLPNIGAISSAVGMKMFLCLKANESRSPQIRPAAFQPESCG